MTIRKPFFVVPHAAATIASVNPTIAGFPAENLAQHAFIGKEFRTATDNNIIIDLGSPKEIDFLGLISTNATIGSRIRWLISNASDFSTIIHEYPAQAMIQPYYASYNGKSHSHAEIPLSTGRYVLAAMDTLPNPFSASHLLIGKKIEFGPSPDKGFYDGGFGKGFEGFEAPAINAGGIPDLQRSAILRTLKFALTTMTKSDFHNKFQPLIYGLRDHRPVYINFDPQADEYRQSNTYFGWLRKPAFATIGQTHPDWHSQELEMLSQI